MEKELIKLKKDYNYNLQRFYNGCTYCETHREEIDKWVLELVRIIDNIENLLAIIKRYITVNDEEILKGFNLDETI